MQKVFTHRCGNVAARTIAAACGLVALGFSTVSRAAIVVNDTWQDSTRTDPAAPVYSENGTDTDADGDIESAWFTSNAAGMTASPGHLTQATVTGSTSWQTYYTPEATPVTLANVGDSMKLTWVFAMANVANDATNNTGQNFRLAIVDSPSANRLTADGTPGAPSGGNYNGYAMFMNVDQTLRRSTPFQLMKRNPTGVAGFLSSSGDWSALANNGTTNNPGYVSGEQYTYTMTLTHNASNGLDIDSHMAGAGLGPSGQGFLDVAFTDTTPAAFTFDMFGLRPSGSATSATSFDTNLFKVEGPALTPEPASLALLGLGALGMIRRRSRK